MFEAAGADFVAINAAGCGSVMKDYGELLKDDPNYAARAAALSRRVRDVSEILAESGLNGTLHPVKLRVAYHDACHLAHGQRVRSQPRTLLAAIPGLDARAAYARRTSAAAAPASTICCTPRSPRSS